MNGSYEHMPSFGSARHESENETDVGFFGATSRFVLGALIVALSVGLAAHLLHVGNHAGHDAGLSTGVYHWLRDSLFAVPVAVLVIFVVDEITRRWSPSRRFVARLRWALMVGLGYAVALVPGGMAHGRLFPAEGHSGDAFIHALSDAVALLPASVYTALAVAFLWGMPSDSISPIAAAFRAVRSIEWTPARFKPAPHAVARAAVAMATFATILPAQTLAVAQTAGPDPVAAFADDCTNRVITADVVALDQPFYYNRLGAINANGMIYALARDVVVTPNLDPLFPDVTAFDGLTLPEFDTGGGNRADLAGQVSLRADKRPRPLTLRANEGDCLQINFTNLLDPVEFIFNLPDDFPTGQILGLGVPIGQQVNDQPLTRLASIHIDGLELLDGIGSDGSNVGQNGPGGDGLVAPGFSTTYTYFAPNRGTNLLYSMGSTVGADGGGGTRSYGLFGAVNVEPGPTGAFPGSDWYRSQLTRQEMDFAAASWTEQADGTWTTSPAQVDAGGNLIIRYAGDDPANQPLVNYEARYPVGATFGGQNEIQSLSIVADGGSFTLEGVTVGPPFTADAIRNALSPDYVVTDSGGSFTIEFVGALAESPRDLLALNGSDLTLTGGEPLAEINKVQNGIAPVDNPFFGTGKEGLPIVEILHGNEIVHSDLNAIIDDRGHPYPVNAAYPTRSNEDGFIGEPFREFTVIFHDEAFGVQAFPGFYNDPVLKHTLHGVADAFPINYGSGGIGSEIVANRLGVGPMWDCAECKYEEFFLTSFTVGDPAMIVDIPANTTGTLPDGTVGILPRAKATKALYPDDPSNVHHAYLGDRVVFRNLHAGPKEHHIFHLHAHQWQLNPDDPQSNYLDGQALGPGSGYTYEIAYGGSGNRNFTVGDSIFHCHFYPHFAQGMWELWRVHDVFERGTLMATDPLDGLPIPAEGSRALPDGEIPSGTPIPGVVPMPGMAMAPMPDPNATIVSYDLIEDEETDKFGTGNSSQFDANGDGVADINQNFADFGSPAGDGETNNVDVNGNGLLSDEVDIFVAMKNPGYPWFTPGLLGHRPPTPALDLATDPDVDGDGNPDEGVSGTWGDGGLPRHIVTSGLNDTDMDVYVSRLDFNKVLHGAAGKQLPEHGTVVEQLAMAFHAGYADTDGNRFYASYFPDGTPAGGQDSLESGFEVNGLDPIAGAPFADPCRSFEGLDGDWTTDYPGGTVELIKGANIEMPITLNKVGWHFQQQRFEALWDDVVPTLNEDRAPQPMIMRLNSTDCAEFWHTNLVPNVYQLDDFQVRTPTDIIGQHIHLVKFDVMSADGAANGWNYEDGTLSPDEVRERIEAFNHGPFTPGGEPAGPSFTDLNNQPVVLEAQAHPFFGATGPAGQNWLGARTTIQRWYADPLLERSWDGGVGTVFTHDHYGPSTHQQVGLYSTLLVEPEGSIWKHNETGELLGTRHDGGPSGWQATIEPGPNGVDFEPYREFYFEFADFQHAYERDGGLFNPVVGDPADLTGDGGVANENLLGDSVRIPSYADFPNAVNPSFRLPPPRDGIPPAATLADIYLHPNYCPGPVGGPVVPRPCAEAISADDPGTYALNFRNEPIGLRVYDPATKGQAAGEAGDLAFAYQSLETRAITELNSQPVGPYPPLTADVRPGDPWTPLLRVYQGDKVRIRVQVGAHEEEHNFTIPGLKWKAEPNSPNSGWKNSEFFGIDEYFNLDVPILPDTSAGNPAVVDYVYTVGAELEGMWNGVWGILRSYSRERNDLYELPSNNMGRNGYEIVNDADFDGICPVGADLQEFAVTAVQAKDVLNKQGEPRGPNPDNATGWDDPGWLVYNSRETSLTAPAGGVAGKGPLIDPTALLYVMTEDVIFDDAGDPIGLRPGTPVEPLVLRAAAGDCVDVNLKNALPATIDDMPGFNALPPIVHKNENADLAGGITSFNANDLRPSSYVGLTAQLLAFDVRDGGFATGLTTGKLIAPGSSGKYRWYAGDVKAENVGVVRNRAQFRLSAEPVEFGAVGLMSADRIKGSESGFVGAMVIEPAGSTWEVDPDTRTQATVTKADGSTSFRDFVAVMQNDINLRYGGVVEVTDAEGAVVQTIDCGLDPSPIECAVPSIAAEGPFGPPEDPQDTGQKAINYGADPLWFRLGVTPDTPFGQLHRNGARADLSANIPDVFSNFLNLGEAGAVGDPQTPVFRASPTGPDEARFRVLMPGGHARGVSWTIHGHDWQRQPYINDSREFGYNPTSEWYGVQEGINPTGHWDFVVDLGGRENVTGDYLFRDQASFGSYQGLWGLLRYDQTAPVAVDDAYQTGAGVPLEIDPPGVLGNDWDLDGGPLTAALEAGPSNGTVTCGTEDSSICADGSFTYTYTGDVTLLPATDSFTYRITDGLGKVSNVATVRITVTDQVLAPVAVDDAYETAIDTPLNVAAPGVLGNDLAADGSPFTGSTAVLDTAAAGPFNGTVSLNLDGSFTYTPGADFSGTDSFRYSFTDGGIDSNKATVTITVLAPVAVDDAYETAINTPLNVAAPGVLGNDLATDGSPFTGSTAVLDTVPLGGTVSCGTEDSSICADGSFTYTPGADFSGTDSFRYSFTDGGIGSNMATVTITVIDYVVTVTDAVYRSGNGRWRIQGTVTDPLDAVTVYLCPGDTWDSGCPVIGVASTNLDGTWSLGTRSGAVPDGNSRVFARSSVGVESAAFIPTIR